MRAFPLLRSGWIFLVLLGGINFTANSPAAGQSEDVFAQCRDLGRGVNVLGYDPIWLSISAARFTAEDFGIIRAGGFSTLRVNLYPYGHMGTAPEYRVSDSWWQTADWIVSHARQAHLNVIIDLHEYEVTGRDPQGNQAKFLAFWRQAAEHFKDAPSDIVFEILNEPNSKMTPKLWNEYFPQALSIIRASNPTRAVIVGPTHYNGIDELKDLRLPDADRHLIVTVHYYEPKKFTHQGAAWTKSRYPVGVVWQGTPQERETITRDFQTAQDWAKAHDRPVFLGEFGAYEKGDMASRARYTECVARTAERFGWGWAYWQFDSDFIVYDIPARKWVEPIYRALIPK